MVNAKKRIFNERSKKKVEKNEKCSFGRNEKRPIAQSCMRVHPMKSENSTSTFYTCPVKFRSIMNDDFNKALLRHFKPDFY